MVRVAAAVQQNSVVLDTVTRVTKLILLHTRYDLPKRHFLLNPNNMLPVVTSALKQSYEVVLFISLPLDLVLFQDDETSASGEVDIQGPEVVDSLLAGNVEKVTHNHRHIRAISRTLLLLPSLQLQ